MVAQVHQQATRMGALRAVALCRCFGGALHFQSGRWSEAASELDEAIDLYRRMGGASGESLSLQRRGVLLTAQGALDHAMSVFDEGVFAAERATMRSHCLTRLYASMARNRLAADHVRAAGEYMRHGELAAKRHGHCVTCNALLLPEAVRVRIASGDRAGAAVNAEELESIARDFGSRAWRAMARQASGRVAAAARDWPAAADAFTESADAYRASGAPYETARSLRCAAEALRHIDPSRAAAAEAEATELLRAVGAPGVEG